MDEKKKNSDVTSAEKKTRNLVFQLRMTKDESELLDMVSYITDDTKADVLRKALRMYASTKKGAY